MDFTNRGPQAQPAPSPAPATTKSKHTRNNDGKWARIGITLVGAAVVILLLALIALISFGGPKSEDKYIDTSKLQAVFLNTGQVYFGNVKALNNKYFVLTNIYYQQDPVDFSGHNRVPCIEQYVESHGGTQAPINIPVSLYEFSFVSPRWSPDLAGWSLLVAALSWLFFIVTFALKRWFKHYVA